MKKQTLTLIFAINLFYFLTLGSQSMLPLYLEGIGASGLYIGVFMTFHSVALIFYVLFMNHRAGKIHKRKALLWSNALALLSSIGMFLQPANLILLIILKLMTSFAFLFSFTMHLAMVYDNVEPERRAAWAAIIGLSGILSNPLGAYISEWVFNSYGGEYLLIVPAVFHLLNIIIISIMPIKDLRHQSKHVPFKIIFSNKQVWLLSYGAIVLGALLGILKTFIPQHTKDVLGEANISLYLTAFGFISVIIRLSLFKIFDVLSKNILIKIAMAGGTIAAALVFWSLDYWMLFVAGLFYGICHSILFPVLSSSMVNLAGAGERDSYNNLFLGINTFGLLFFTSIGGWVADFFGLDILLIATIGLGVSGILVFTFNRHILGD